MWHTEVPHLCAQGRLLHVQPTFTCGHIPAYHVLANVQTCMQLAFRTPHVCAYSFHSKASPHMTHTTLVAAVGHYMEAGCPCTAHCILMFVLPAYVRMLSSRCVCVHAAFMCRLYFAGELDGI